MGCKLVDTKNENSNICNMFLKKEKKKCYIIRCTQREVHLSWFTLIAKLNHKIGLFWTKYLLIFITDTLKHSSHENKIDVGHNLLFNYCNLLILVFNL